MTQQTTETKSVASADIIGTIWGWASENFHEIAGWASIFGLAISVVILFRLRSIAKKIQSEALRINRHKLFEVVRNKLVGSPRLTPSHKKDIERLLIATSSKYCVRIRVVWIKDLIVFGRYVYRLIREIRGDMESDASPEYIVTKLDQLRILTNNKSSDQ